MQRGEAVQYRAGAKSGTGVHGRGDPLRFAATGQCGANQSNSGDRSSTKESAEMSGTSKYYVTKIESINLTLCGGYSAANYAPLA